MKKAVFASALVLAGTTVAVAQTPDLGALLPKGEASATGRVIQLGLLLTALSVAPGVLIMVTSFTRFVIALSFLRSGLGMQTTPPNIVLISLAMFMTLFVMTPTFNTAWTNGLQPLLEQQISEQTAYVEITRPFRDFMLKQTRDKDLQLLESLSAGRFKPGDEGDLRTLIPAFMVSELRRGFEIGFLIVLPFLAIDLIVATITMSMGMMMLPPSIVSLPAKILFFILMDGWSLLVGSLVRSVR
jgi:flagellar biosynthetic protein FliP